MTAGVTRGYRRPIRICCQQLDPVFADLSANRERALAAIDEGIDGGAEVIVLPELATSGYMFASAEEAAPVAITPDHEILAEWAALAVTHGVVIAGGFCEDGKDGRVYNSALLCDPAGGRAVYRKLHLWDGEKRVFGTGSAVPPVVDTRLGRLSVMICYDLEFPELTRTVALAGTQLLLVPTNWPLMERPAGERPAEAVIAMATARINRMAVACADRTGVEREQPWTGGSTIIDADGWVVGDRGDRSAGPVFGEVDLGRALDKRYSELADVFADRRPALYGAVTAG